MRQGPSPVGLPAAYTPRASSNSALTLRVLSQTLSASPSSAYTPSRVPAKACPTPPPPPPPPPPHVRRGRAGPAVGPPRGEGPVAGGVRAPGPGFRASPVAPRPPAAPTHPPPFPRNSARASPVGDSGHAGCHDTPL